MTRTGQTGVSLAKGPIAILGKPALAYGVLALILGGNSFGTAQPSEPPVRRAEPRP